MKVICNRGALLEALNVTGAVVQARTPKPVLQCLKLTAEDNALTVAATDLEVAIRYTDNQVQIEQAGEALLPADKLRDIVRESVDDTLSIEVNGDTANIRGQDSHFKIFTQAVADFPPIPDFEGEPDFQIPGGSLKQLIGQTLFAAAKEGTRYAFNGVLINAKAKKISMVSTDGRRLALAKGDLAPGDKLDKEGKKAIVPAKALNLIEKLIDEPEELVGIQIRENQIIFHTSTATLTSNLVEGQFPPFEDVIPKDTDKQMSASTADFLGAIRRSALLTTEESKGVRLSFNKKGLVLQSRSPESGEATVNFACKFEGADVEIGFNPQFVIDALRVVDSDEVTLELTAPNRPGLLKGGPNFLYVIMPVNCSESRGDDSMKTNLEASAEELKRLYRVKSQPPLSAAALGQEMIEFFKQSVTKRQGKIAKLAEAWGRLVPENISEHCSLEGFSKGTLTVLVDSSSHLYDIKQLLLSGLERQLLLACKTTGLKKINLKAGRWYDEGDSRRVRFESRK